MAKGNKGIPIHGWVVLDKPLNMSSAKAVAMVKKLFNAQKAGHGGTLDPLATGVLPIALGEATKTVDYVLSAEKHYEYSVEFGKSTNTDDMEGEVIKTSTNLPTKQQILDVIPKFTGKIMQTPPKFSAIKMNGVPAYKSMRGGEDVVIPPREIEIYKLELLNFDGQTADFRVFASKGTYVRSLARDMGEKLGCFGFVTALRRIKAGKFAISDAISKEKLDLCSKMGHCPQEFLKGLTEVLDDIPAYKAEPREILQLQNGAKLTRIHLKPQIMKVVNSDNKLISLVNVGENGEVKILRNFNL